MALYRKTFVTGSQDTIGLISADRYIAIGDTSSGSTYATTEDYQKTKIYSSETFEKARIYIFANTKSTTFNVRLRINGANGNNNIAVTSSTTGWFEDTSNTDSVVSGDFVNFLLDDNGGTGSINPFHIAIDAVGSLNYTRLLSNVADTSGTSFSTASTTNYIRPLGVHTRSATETDIDRCLIATAATAKNMFVYIATNARTTTTTWRFRINAADGNINIGVTSTATGWFEDTSNTDTLSAADNITYSFTTGTGTGSFTYSMVGVELHGSGASVNKCLFMNGNLQTSARYWLIAGQNGNSTTFGTETYQALTMRGSGTVRNLYITVSVNTAASGGSVTYRKNSANTALTKTITGSTTGTFSDTSNSFSYVDGDTLDISTLRVGAGTLTVRAISAEFEVADEDTGGGVFTPYYSLLLQCSGSGMNV